MRLSARFALPPAPGATAALRLTAHKRGALVRLAVEDRGPGVPEADRNRVLERFVRLEASRTMPGSGLGLSLAAAIARLHGGSLQLEDNAPGLRAIIALPLVSAPSQSASLKRMEPASATRQK